MTRKWGRAEDWARVALIQRQKARGLDGETCEICKKHEDGHGIKALIIEHIKGYDPDWTPNLDELQLAHQSCNIRKLSPRELPKTERERTASAVPTFQDSYSNHKAFVDQPDYREYVLKAVLESPKEISLESINRDACEFVKANIQTGLKWMQRLISNEGPFHNPENTKGFLRFRKEYYKFLNYVELTELFPCHTRISEDEKQWLIGKAEQRMKELDLKEAEAGLPLK